MRRACGLLLGAALVSAVQIAVDDDGSAASDLGRIEERLLRDAVKRDPRDARAHYQLGVHFMGAFDVVEAERHLRTAIHIDPKHAEEARVALCNLLRSQAVPEDFDDAVRTYREAIEANPANDTAHWMLSQLLSMRRDLDVRDGAVLGETQELYDYMRSVPSLRRGSGAPDDGARARRGESGGEARLAQLIECRRKRR